SVDVIISSGGTGLTGRDVTFEAIDELLEKKIDGFSAIFHMISFQKIKTSTIQSRVFAGIINGTYVFCLPGSPSAVKDAWDEILVYQLDISHKPCNLIEIKDRLKE
ncbi:MAG: molybdopterin-binding protein, partial [Pseudomonadota bacterium]|nr:molybdopterin-binding protein [Pseudomonadota bacterium]